MRGCWKAAGLVVLLATQGCWLQAGGGPQRQGYTGTETEVSAANVVDLTEVWTATGGSAPREALVDGARAYIRTSGGIRALEFRTGATVWTTPEATPIGGDRLPAIVGDTLYVPDTSGACWLSQVDTDTGALLDRQLISPEPLSNSVCFAGDALRIGSTVAMRWSHIRFAEYAWCSGSGFLSRNHWGVTAVDVEGGPGGWNVDTVDADWMCGIRQERLHNEASSAEPGSVVVTENSNVVQIGCTGEGCPAGWSVRLAYSGGVAVGPPVVLHNGDVASYHHQLLVIDGTTHTAEWTADLPSTRGSRLLASDPDTIFVPTGDGGVAAFPIDGCGAPTCTPSWTAVLPSPASARPSIGGNVLYVGSDDGSVSAFAASGCGAATCAPLWTGSTPAAITGAPVIAGGRVIVGSSNGVVTAFALPDTGTGT